MSNVFDIVLQSYIELKNQSLWQRLKFFMLFTNFFHKISRIKDILNLDIIYAPTFTLIKEASWKRTGNHKDLIFFTSEIYQIPENKFGEILKKMQTTFSKVKPLIRNTSKEFIKCRILHFLIMVCCRYLVF